MEQLIEEVRTRPVIWDCTSELYRDFTLKDKAWDEIAEVLLRDSKYTIYSALISIKVNPVQMPHILYFLLYFCRITFNIVAN